MKKIQLITTLLTLILSLFSTIVMGYISLATPIGPWIAPTLVLVGYIFLRACMIHFCPDDLAYAVAGGSVGGIIATACGFSFPTLYFLAPEIFAQWMISPLFFAVVLGSLALSASLWGFLVADIVQNYFLNQLQMPFPIGQLVYSMIYSTCQISNALQLGAGFLSACIFSLLQIPIGSFGALLPDMIQITKNFSFFVVHIPALVLPLNVLPMLLAIGFVAGRLIALPLVAGIISKIFILDPLQVIFFPAISVSDFTLTFCSGIVISGAVQSFLDIPSIIHSAIKKRSQKKWVDVQEIKKYVSTFDIKYSLIVIICIATGFFFKMNILEQIYLLVVCTACTYQIVLIAGKIGLAQLGRFATFAMVPALFIFGIDYVKATFIATFVEIAGGVATDLLFSRKMALMAGISMARIKRYQLLGIVISVSVIGIIFWLLISHFGLGSAQLYAQRAQARALLVHIQHFDLKLLTCGALFGLFLKKIKLNPMLVLGGLLMPIPYSLGLVLGGMCTLVVDSITKWEPFWSGMFAANSLWQLCKALS